VNKRIIVWCVYMCVHVYVCACVCCVCVACTYSGVDMYPSIRTYIYSHKLSSFLSVFGNLARTFFLI